jgi:hypothetical protein
MKHKLMFAAAATALAIAPGASAAPAASHLSGGGTATISQVAVNVTLGPSGTASGTFECLMAGRSAWVLPPFGLAHNMIVHATPTTATRSGSLVRFAGPARLTMDGSQHMDVHVHVWIDAASDAFQLVVDEVGAMPVETLLSGDFSVR